MMGTLQEIKLRDIWLVSNLMSLSRILLTPLIVYFLYVGTHTAAMISLAILVLAALTDFADGYLARRLGQVSALGLILDPIADKVLTISLIVALIGWRDFPIWLGAFIIGRDLAIVGAGVLLSSKVRRIPSSDIYGKYYFASIAILLVSYIIAYEFGIRLITVTTLALLLITTVSYGYTLRQALQGKEDRSLLKNRYCRQGVSLTAVIVLVLYLYRLVENVMAKGI